MTHQLPVKPDLEQLRKQARELLRSCKLEDPAALARLRAHFPTTSDHSQLGRFKLSDILLVIAREYGFASWPKLKAHVESVANVPSVELPSRAAPSDAKALFELMMAALRLADSISLTIDKFQSLTGVRKHVLNHKILLQKPFYSRVEVTYPSDETLSNTSITDGLKYWCYWPLGRPPITTDERHREAWNYPQEYMTGPAPHGLNGEVSRVASNGSMLNLSICHGGSPFWEPQITDVRSRGTEVVAGELCDVISLHHSDIMGMGICLWLSQVDHLPRRVGTFMADPESLMIEEEWSRITVGKAWSHDFFKWSPTPDWTEFSLSPTPRLIEAGSHAPDFEVTSTRGEIYSLQTLRGKIVVLFFGLNAHDGGTQPCAEVCQRLYEAYNGRGVSIIGLAGFGDGDQYLNDYIERDGIAFPVVQFSKQSMSLLKAYGLNSNGTFVIVDRSGIVAESWTGDYGQLEDAIRRVI